MSRSPNHFRIAVVALVLTATTSIHAATITFRHGGGSGYVNLTGDAVSINTSPVPDATPPDWTTYQLRASSDPAPADFSDTSADRFFVLFGLKDLLAELPITSGQITTATLTVIGSWGDGDTIDVYRVTTDWMANAAGSNESDTSGSYADVDTVTTWTSGAFSTADFELASKQTHTYDAWPGAYKTETPFDATQVLKDSITAGAFYGWCMTNKDASDENIIVMNPAAGANSSIVTVEFTDTNTYTLTVNSGSGSGTYYASDVVEIVAEAAPSGLIWDDWEGDTSALHDPSQSTTNVTMPASDVEVTATYSGCTPPNGDLDGSGFVGQGDLDIVLDQWGNSGPEITDPRADPSGDDFVGQADLDIVLDDWGKSCEED